MVEASFVVVIIISPETGLKNLQATFILSFYSIIKVIYPN